MVKVLDDVTGAQTSSVQNIGPPPVSDTIIGGPARFVEAILTGTIASITPVLEVSIDGTNFVALASGSAGDSRLSGSTLAPYARVTTTGTGGTYDVDLIVSER